MIEVKLKVIKQLFSNWENDYSVISCVPIEVKNGAEIELNDYGNFTLSGSGLGQFTVGNEYTLRLERDVKSKYPASYTVDGYSGVNGTHVDSEANLEILKAIINSDQQAQYVHDAYPNFVELVLQGKEAEIDYEKIYNVGEKRLPQYIDAVKSNCKTLMFYPIFSAWGIKQSKHITRLTTLYHSADELSADLNKQPYNILINTLDWSFKKADPIILKKFPTLRDSAERCNYACIDTLKRNEQYGNTRMSASALAAVIHSIAPETMRHIVDTVNNSDFIHYEPSRKLVSLLSTYNAEKNIAENITQRVKHPDEFEVNVNKYRHIDGFDLTDEQLEILRLVANNNVAILTGSGGTGKTSSVKALIDMLDDKGKTYALLAPTGVAAKRLRQATNRQTSTIHMFLITEAALSYHDVIILDESSMIPVSLLSTLFSAINKQTKVVFIADEAQLASISCGNVVQDIIDSGIVPRANLTKVFRYGIGGIATVSTDIRNGISSSINGEYSDYKFIQSDGDVIQQLLDEYGKQLSAGYDANDIMVLCPYNKSDIGTYRLNSAIQLKYNKQLFTDISYDRDGNTITLKIGDKVINTRNNYSVDVCDVRYNQIGAKTFIANGDIGIVKRCEKDGVNVAVYIQFDDKLVVFKQGDIGDLLLGYAISVHKSQGSQAKSVIVVIDKSHKSMLSRNLMYVATSRAQKNMCVIGDYDTIAHSLLTQENKERNTNLKEMLDNDTLD